MAWLVYFHLKFVKILIIWYADGKHLYKVKLHSNHVEDSEGKIWFFSGDLDLAYIDLFTFYHIFAVCDLDHKNLNLLPTYHLTMVKLCPVILKSLNAYRSFAVDKQIPLTF
jgi:hypothetical protein